MLIVLSGLPATGKSLLADGLARALGLPVFSVDPIESAMLRAGLAPGFETGFAAYLVAETLADAQLARGQGAIVDAVNAEEEGKDLWRALARRHGLAPRLIECTCSDPALHRERLAGRRRGLAASFPEPSWEDVERRRAATTAWREPVLQLDAVQASEHNLAAALAWLSR